MAKTMASLQAFPSSLLPRARSRALIPFPFPFERLPHRLLLELNLLQAEIVIIDPMPYQSTHFLYAIENSPMDLSRESQTSTNTSEFDHQQRWEMTRSLLDSLSKVQGCESFIFQTYVTFSIDFPNIHAIICLPILLIHLFCFFGKRRRFLPPRSYAFLTSSLHIRLDTVFNQIW